MNQEGADGATCSLPPWFTGICDTCAGPNDGAKNYYVCAECFDKWQNAPQMAPVFHQKVSLRGGKQPTVGHIKDIKSRRLAEDGKGVTRDKGTHPIYSFGGV